MTDQSNNRLAANPLAALKAALHQGSEEASRVLAKWIGKMSVIEIDSLDQLPLEEATSLLAAGDEPVCFCSTEMNGLLTGELILAFDEASGLALADMLLDQSPGTTNEWTEMAISAALETANILFCAYLNSLLRSCSKSHESVGLLPSPPQFHCEFAESLLEFALMGQAIASDQAILARTKFEIDATPVDCTLLFVPDAQSLSRLPELWPAGDIKQ